MKISPHPDFIVISNMRDKQKEHFKEIIKSLDGHISVKTNASNDIYWIYAETNKSVLYEIIFLLSAVYNYEIC